MDVAKEFGVGKDQVYKVMKDKERVEQCVTKCGMPACSKPTRSKSKYPAIDDAVFDWFCSIRKLRGSKKPLPLSQSLLTARALFEAKLRGCSNFKASNGWFSNWRRRYNIRNSVYLHGEAADIDIPSVEFKIEELRTALQL